MSLAASRPSHFQPRESRSGFALQSRDNETFEARLVEMPWRSTEDLIASGHRLVFLGTASVAPTSLLEQELHNAAYARLFRPKPDFRDPIGDTFPCTNSGSSPGERCSPAQPAKNSNQ